LHATIILDMKLVIPQVQRRNVLLFYLLTAFYSLWFVEAVWYFYWSKFASYTVIGLMFSVLTIVWIVAEIPTGAFADRYGRKLSVNIGAFLQAIGAVLLAAAPNIWWLFLGGFLENIGRAFISGSLEALVFDDLKADKSNQEFDKVMAFKAQVALIAFTTGVLIGGFAFLIYFRLPHILQASQMILAFLVSFGLKERLRPSNGKSLKNVLKQNLVGFQQLGKITLRPFLLPALTLMLLFFLYDWGFSKPALAVHFGLYSRGQAILYAAMAVIAVGAVGLLPKIRRKVGDTIALPLLVAVAGLGFVLGGLPLGLMGIGTILAIDLSGNIGEPWISIIVNKHLESQYRATSLSTLQFLVRVPFIFINIIAGRAIDAGWINSFHIIIGISALALALISLKIRKIATEVRQN